MQARLQRRRCIRVNSGHCVCSHCRGGHCGIFPGECEVLLPLFSRAAYEPRAHATFGTPSEHTGRPRFLDRWLTARLEDLLATVDVRVQLWDGHPSGTSSRPPIGTLTVGDRRTLLGLIVNPELWFGEASMTAASRCRVT